MVKKSGTLAKPRVGSLLFDIGNHIFLILLMISMVYPFIYMISNSISDFREVATNAVKLFPRGPLNLNAYKTLVASQDIPRGYLNSIIYATVTVVFTLIVSSMSAYVLEQKRLTYRKPLIIFVVITMFLPGGMIPTYLVINSLGLMNTLWAITLPPSFSAWYILIMRSNIRSTITQELLDACHIDGANEFQIYWKVALPLIKPILATIGLFAVVASWNNYMGPLLYLSEARKYPLTMILRKLLTGAWARESTFATYYRESLYLQDEIGGKGFFIALKYAAMIVAIWPIMVVYPFLQKYFVRGILVGSIKG